MINNIENCLCVPKYNLGTRIEMKKEKIDE